MKVLSLAAVALLLWHGGAVGSRNIEALGLLHPVSSEGPPRSDVCRSLLHLGVGVQPGDLQPSRLAMALAAGCERDILENVNVPKNVGEPVTCYVVGEALMRVSGPGSAADVWKSCPGVARRLAAVCASHHNAGRVAEASRYCEAARDVGPGIQLVQSVSGRLSLYGFRDARAAVEQLGSAVGLGDRSSSTVAAFAHALAILGRDDEAQEVLERYKPRTALAAAVWGDINSHRGHDSVALTFYLEAEALGMAGPWLMHAIASTMLRLGDADSAERRWRRALEMDPSFEPAHMGLRRLNER